MIISAFAETIDVPSASRTKLKAKNKGVARAHAALKRDQAAERQKSFDLDVAKTAADQNVTEGEARHVVRERRRMEHRLAERRAEQG
jgi:hypothetical protein